MKKILIILLVFVLVLVFSVIAIDPLGFRSPLSPTGVPTIAPTDSIQSLRSSTTTPNFASEIIVDGLNNPWDIIMLPDESYIFSERANKLTHLANGVKTSIPTPDDTVVRGEGGLLGLAIDPEFSSNRFIYACFNSNLSGNTDVRVVRWKLSLSNDLLEDRRDIITGIPANESGRHSGCQLEFGPDNYLWVGTGDAAIGSTPQDPTSLGGKILRVDRDGGPALGNLDQPFDSRIYSYGHRNTQGLAFFSEELNLPISGISIEHGSAVDDEVNPLLAGNFGWDPPAGYLEGGVPMTDVQKYPEAILALWSSGSPTIATSGGTIIKGEKWLKYENAIAVAAQKGSRIMLLITDPSLNILQREDIYVNEIGRVRTIQSLKDNELLILTDNGKGTDKIIRVYPL